MKQYENVQEKENKDTNDVSFWTRLKPTRKRRIKKLDDNAHNSETKLTNFEYIVNGLPFRKTGRHGHIESVCNGHTVCDNIAIDDSEDDNEDAIVQIVDNFDNLMAVPEGQETIEKLNTPSTSYGCEMTHIWKP